MNDYVVIGKFKKEYKILMLPYEDIDFGKEFFGYDKGDSATLYLSDKSDRFDERDNMIFELRIRYMKFELSRADVLEYLDIVYETGSYNSCVQNGIPCKNLTGYDESDIINFTDKQSSTSSCNMHWDLGRGICSLYKGI